MQKNVNNRVSTQHLVKILNDQPHMKIQSSPHQSTRACLSFETKTVFCRGVLVENLLF
jgi:hypothetical protein